ncbi:hypothetical protein NM688_g6976 [Phlebia brevispora]|uniref:Uncharacterized protein n=1 Tax=Phlebia brevispora TaxID=194682 RepID=A0ACC1SAJ6_9APHY|nr:hypothetical protein NM688_g6976 [Phlebia brevispora]
MDAAHFLDEDVPDPTDFPESAPGLRQLDDALRCRCIRTDMSDTADPKCPLCRSPVSEMQLRKNQAMEDAVKAWQEARSLVLNLVSEERRSRVASSQPSTSTSGTMPNTPRKKRKLTPRLDVIDDDIVEMSNLKKKGPASSTVPDAQTSSEAQPGIVKCPVCERLVPLKTVNDHIDQRCPSPTPSELERASAPKADGKEQWSKFFSVNAGKSPAVGSKSKKKGKAKWVILWNANRDASPARRKTVKQLRDELKKWEEAITEGKRKKAKEEDFDAAVHEETHKSMFALLTEKARQSTKGTKNKDTLLGVDSSEAEIPTSSQPSSSQQTNGSHGNTIVIDDE